MTSRNSDERHYETNLTEYSKNGEITTKINLIFALNLGFPRYFSTAGNRNTSFFRLWIPPKVLPVYPVLKAKWSRNVWTEKEHHYNKNSRDWKRSRSSIIAVWEKYSGYKQILFKILMKFTKRENIKNLEVSLEKREEKWKLPASNFIRETKTLKNFLIQFFKSSQWLPLLHLSAKNISRSEFS